MSFDWRQFQGVNAAYVQELYERYRRDPQSVDENHERSVPSGAFRIQAIPGFQDSRASGIPEPRIPGLPEFKNPQVIVGAVNLAQSIRRYGHLAAPSIRWAAAPSAIRRSSPRRTASPTPICARCRRR